MTMVDEDLGEQVVRPASMWQWPQLADLLRKGLRTVATMTRVSTLDRYPLHRVSKAFFRDKLQGLQNHRFGTMAR